MTTLSLSDIQAARERIKDRVELTPCDYSEILSRLYDCHLYLKLENLQITGSFKPRGAFNKMLQLTAEQRAAGVVAASAGNHAQGVAYAARQLGIAATIVMPETTPLAKIRGTEELGASIVLHGSRYGEAYDKACELQQQHGYTFVHAFDDPHIIAGQGTIGLEILEQVPDADIIVVPIGGGGLISGIALVIKHIRPDIRLIGVQAERIPAMKTSLEAGHIQPHHPANTIADGISIAKVGQHTFPLVQQYIDEVVTVNEEAIANAIMMLLEHKRQESRNRPEWWQHRYDHADRDPGAGFGKRWPPGAVEGCDSRQAGQHRQTGLTGCSRTREYSGNLPASLHQRGGYR